jgi:hypothetical protein
MRKSISDSPTKKLFECLRNLYRQTQQLLLDSDRLLGDRGWEPVGGMGPAEFSYSIGAPDKWFARWAARFYLPQSTIEAEADERSVISMLFVSTQLASDNDTDVEEPVISAGYLLFNERLTRDQARKAWGNSYWLCKSGLWGKPINDPIGWCQWDPSKWIRLSQLLRTFTVPLYSITSSDALKELVIDKLISALPLD